MLDTSITSVRLSFYFATYDSGSTNTGIKYLSKYPDPFYNASISPVSHTLFKSNLFGSVNESDSHKNIDSLV